MDKCIIAQPFFEKKWLSLVVVMDKLWTGCAIVDKKDTLWLYRLETGNYMGRTAFVKNFARTSSSPTLSFSTVIGNAGS